MSTLFRISRRDLLSAGGAEPDPIIHIASLLVHATPSGCNGLRNLISELPDAELHETGIAGKLAIVLEAADERLVADAFSRVQNLAGVINVSIVSHLTETHAALEQEVVDESAPILKA